MEKVVKLKNYIVNLPWKYSVTGATVIVGTFTLGAWKMKLGPFKKPKYVT